MTDSFPGPIQLNRYKFSTVRTSRVDGRTFKNCFPVHSRYVYGIARFVAQRPYSIHALLNYFSYTSAKIFVLTTSISSSYLHKGVTIANLPSLMQLSGRWKILNCVPRHQHRAKPYTLSAKDISIREHTYKWGYSYRHCVWKFSSHHFHVNLCSGIICLP